MTSLAYLDHAATTPMRPEAVEAMLPFLTERFANPSGSHGASRDARRGVDEARDVVAEGLGGAPGEVVFTGCGTEADNLAVLGTVRRHGGVAVCSAAEHHAVLHAVEHVGGRVVSVDAAGAVDLAALADALDETVRVVSVMAVNNEVGTISPLAEVAALVRERAPGAVLHTDAVQGLQWLDLAAAAADYDLVAVSAHKFGGPKGVGALLVRGSTSVEPLLMGGGQERDRRSGTHNVAGIVAMAEAMRVTVATRTETVARVQALRDRLVDGLVAAGARPPGDRTGRRFADALAQVQDRLAGQHRRPGVRCAPAVQAADGQVPGCRALRTAAARAAAPPLGECLEHEPTIPDLPRRRRAAGQLQHARRRRHGCVRPAAAIAAGRRPRPHLPGRLASAPAASSPAALRGVPSPPGRSERSPRT